MAFDVTARFTVLAESEDEARKILEGLLVKHLDPAKLPVPHDPLDSWAVEGLPGWTYALDVRCETRRCKNDGKVINTITGIESVAERETMMEGWKDAPREEDVCPLCGELGHPEERS